MRCTSILLLSLVCLTICAQAQTTHSIGIGTFVNSPFVTGAHPYADDEKRLVRVSPFVNYTLEFNWLNFSISAGNWNSTFIYELHFDSTFTNPGGTNGNVIYGYNYAFVPIAIGANVVTTQRWEVVAEVTAMLKYLHTLNFDIESDDPSIAKAIRQFTGSELDKLNYKRFGTAVGGGLYLAYNGGRFIPKLQAGYVTDLNDVYKSGSENYKFSHPYVALSVNYILKHSAKLEKHDHWIKW